VHCPACNPALLHAEHGLGDGEFELKLSTDVAEAHRFVTLHYRGRRLEEAYTKELQQALEETERKKSDEL
jgi:hypothetical protein